MHKIRNKNFVVSPAVFKDNQLYLLHTDDFANTGSHFTGYIEEEDSLRQVFDTETEFFYTIENFDSDNIHTRQLIHQERGLGHIHKSGDDYIFIRDVALEVNQRDHDLQLDEEGFLKFNDDSFLVVGSYIPTNYIDLFYKEHSVICSTESLTPTPIELQENSLLGRLNGEIKSLKPEEIAIILANDCISQSLLHTHEPILVSTNHLEMVNEKSKLLSSHIVIKPRPSKPRNREKGTIIFNSSKNTLEFYDGEKWKSIKTE